MIKSDHIEAPFTEDQVKSLNGYQKSGYCHPFTCGNDKCPKPRFEHSILVAKSDGWHCPRCAYTQTWAHKFMADGSWKEMNPDRFGL
jgi:ribosomal protein S27AE